MKLEVRRDDLSGAEVQALLREHMAGMMINSPPESVHALPLEGLLQPEITFWSVWLGSELAGCGALKDLGGKHGEIKSMRTRQRFLRQGVGQAALSTIVLEAQTRGYTRLSLETGSTEAFKPAQALYLRNGFEACGPFGDYKFDPFSVYMTKSILQP
jgi:putative acetyltransferase